MAGPNSRHPQNAFRTSGHSVGAELAQPASTQELLATMSREIGPGLTLLEEGLIDMYRNGEINPQRLKSMIQAAMRGRRATKASQQVARLLEGKVRQTHERLSLKDIINAHLSQRAESFKRRGVQIKTSVKPADVIIDSGLLMSLVDSCIDWALERGKVIIVTLGIKNWPEHAQLVIKARPSVTVQDGSKSDTPEDSMVWYVLRETARVMGVSLQRTQSGEESTVVIEFPRTVRDAEGVSTVEIDSMFHNSAQSASQPMAGYRVLLISADPVVRVQLRDATRGMGFEVDSVGSITQAIQYCEMDIPHIIVIDENLKNDMFEELRQDILRQNGNFPFIEISDKSDGFQMSGWTEGSYTRIGRDTIQTHLTQALSFEMARVM